MTNENERSTEPDPIETANLEPLGGGGLRNRIKKAGENLPSPDIGTTPTPGTPVPIPYPTPAEE